MSKRAAWTILGLAGIMALAGARSSIARPAGSAICHPSGSPVSAPIGGTDEPRLPAVGTSAPASMTSAARLPPFAPLAFNCSDCISLCIFQQCGFFEDPQCVADNYGPCSQACVDDGSC